MIVLMSDEIKTLLVAELLQHRQQNDTLLKITRQHFQTWGLAWDSIVIWSCVLAAEMRNSTRNMHHANYTTGLIVFTQEQQNRSKEPAIWEYIIQQLLSSGLICLWQKNKNTTSFAHLKKKKAFFFYLFITRCEQGDMIKGPTCQKKTPHT